MDIKLPRVEILVSTMNRVSLEFLWEMFLHNNHYDFNILIVNQTTPDKQLVSEYSHINVINSFDYGVPKSRNLALKNATADICLMADDDIVYLPKLKAIIVNAHYKYPEAAMLSFEAVDVDGKRYANYNSEGIHTKRSLKNIYTWVISFKREQYLKHQIYYNAHFGFGAVFQGGEEYVFLRNGFDKALLMRHISQSIVQHPNESSGRLMGSANAVFSRAALKQRYDGNLSYFWLLKYVFFLWRRQYIDAKEIIPKYHLGLEGIATYKSLAKSGEIDKIYDI